MTKPIVPVVMCTWRRPENLPITIQSLKKQKGVSPHLYIWNNNPKIAARIDTIAATADIPVEVIHSDTNVGGFGRFYYARQLADLYKYIVFIDDDQMLEEGALTVLRREAKPHQISGWWAYNFLTSHSYWLRLPAAKGRPAAYIGTCGMIIDSSIFKDERLFECPKEYWFVEDLWLSYFADHIHNWRLQRSHARFRFLPDTKNQFAGLMRKKGRFLRYLKTKGWNFRIKLPRTDSV